MEKKETTAAELVFVPMPGMGQLVPMIELAKILLERDSRFSITVLVITAPFDPSVTEYTRALVASGTTRIRYVELPQVEPPSSENLLKSPEKYISDYIESHKTHVRDAITNHVLCAPIDFESAGSCRRRRQLAGVVVDMFCTTMIDVANDFGVPSYLFFPSTASLLGLQLYLPIRHAQIGTKFDESGWDRSYSVPSYANPVPSRVLPSVLFSKEGGYESFVNHATRFRETKGIIVNTFAELEPYAVNSFTASGRGNDSPYPLVYPVGPLLDLKGRSRSGSDRDRIMKWLDEQPLSSVVFVCFGSLGSFGLPQLAEIANGLERSGHRFLWSVRRPSPKDIFVMPNDSGGDYSDMLPEGFVERTRGRGVVCGWAPQAELLAHGAIGGFVTHCGWNSILESLWHGVPIVTWPIFAEQQLNAFQMVREWGLGVELRLDYRGNMGGGGSDNGIDLVTAIEIEKAISCVMMDENNLVRKRVKEMREKSRKTLVDGGSSFASLGELVDDMLGSSAHGLNGA